MLGQTRRSTVPYLRMLVLSLGLIVVGTSAHGGCSPKLPPTRPDSRYEAVPGATPPNSEVRDKVTGLVWQRCPSGLTWNGTKCAGETQIAMTWGQVPAYINSNVAPTTANPRTNWRLPTRDELQSLVDSSCISPALNTRWFPERPTNNTISYVYWTSTLLNNPSYPGFVWTVSFDKGESTGMVDYTSLSTRFVRSGN
jgi:hypothetical protein